MSLVASIRPANEADDAEIQALLIEAFEGDGEAALVEGLRADDGVAAELVALNGGRVVGYVMFCDLHLEIAGAKVPAAGLAPLAVRDDCRRRGIGHALVLDGLARCAQAQRDVVIVLGDPAYYGRFGFSARMAQGLASVYAGPALQALELRPGALGQGVGRLTYPRAFDALS